MLLRAGGLPRSLTSQRRAAAPLRSLLKEDTPSGSSSCLQEHTASSRPTPHTDGRLCMSQAAVSSCPRDGWSSLVMESGPRGRKDQSWVGFLVVDIKAVFYRDDKLYLSASSRRRLPQLLLSSPGAQPCHPVLRPSPLLLEVKHLVHHCFYVWAAASSSSSF